MNFEHFKDNYEISTDKSKLQLNVIHNFLRNAYWSENIPLKIVEKSIQNSLCYGVYFGKEQVGFARVITDYATFAYLADVFVLETHRGKGLSKWLMECLLEHPDLQSIRTMMLKTEDAHGLYKKYGFALPDKPERIMEKRVIKSY